MTITDRSDSKNQMAISNAIQAVLLNDLDEDSSSSLSSSSSLHPSTVFKGKRCSVKPLDWGSFNQDVLSLLIPSGDSLNLQLNYNYLTTTTIYIPFIPHIYIFNQYYVMI